MNRKYVNKTIEKLEKRPLSSLPQNIKTPSEVEMSVKAIVGETMEHTIKTIQGNYGIEIPDKLHEILEGAKGTLENEFNQNYSSRGKAFQIYDSYGRMYQKYHDVIDIKKMRSELDLEDRKRTLKSTLKIATGMTLIGLVAGYTAKILEIEILFFR